MPRLPEPGGDKGNWGEILNEFLSQSLSANGALKNNVIQESHLSSELQTKVNAAGILPADKAKLDAIAPNATANSSDATLLSRANHTGQQAISTVTNLQSTLNGLFSPVTNAKVLVTQDFTLASTPRVTSRTDVTVRWRGPVEPTQMLTGDEWYVTES